jgi:hypothetical protein
MSDSKIQKYLYKLQNINYNQNHPKYNIYMTKYEHYVMEGGNIHNYYKLLGEYQARFGRIETIYIKSPSVEKKNIAKKFTIQDSQNLLNDCRNLFNIINNSSNINEEQKVHLKKDVNMLIDEINRHIQSVNPSLPHI